MEENNNVEEQLSELLIEGEMQRNQPGLEAPKRLSPRYEIRIPAKTDPIVEETEKYREIAHEVDDRYDKYMRDDKEK